jgi:hypothetical protein
VVRRVNESCLKDSNLLAIFAGEREDSSQQPKIRVFWRTCLLRVFCSRPLKFAKKYMVFTNLCMFFRFFGRKLLWQKNMYSSTFIEAKNKALFSMSLVLAIWDSDSSLTRIDLSLLEKRPWKDSLNGSAGTIPTKSCSCVSDSFGHCAKESESISQATIMRKNESLLNKWPISLYITHKLQGIFF